MDTIELPKLKRMPQRQGGHVIYGTSDESICPEHKFCAYTGDEVARCHICHALHFTDEHGDMPPERTAPCVCPRCGELFSSKTSFDKHKRPNFGCYKPEKRGLILVDDTDKYGTVWQIWANPGSRPDDI